MTWLVLFEFEKANDAALTLVGVSHVLKERKIEFRGAGVREVKDAETIP